MNKLLVALIAASFATVAGAQTGATTKEKAKMVESVTKSQAAETTGAATAPGAAAAKATKADPKALKDKGAKQAAVASTTQAQVKETTGAAAAQGSAAAKAAKSDPKAEKPNLKDPAVQKDLAKKSTQ